MVYLVTRNVPRRINCDHLVKFLIFQFVNPFARTLDARVIDHHVQPFNFPRACRTSSCTAFEFCTSVRIKIASVCLPNSCERLAVCSIDIRQNQAGSIRSKQAGGAFTDTGRVLVINAT